MTVSAQLPWLPVTLTVDPPAGTAGSVSGAGTVPVAVETVTLSMLSAPPEVVFAVGEVQLQFPFGKEPPMPRLNTR